MPEKWTPTPKDPQIQIPLEKHLEREISKINVAACIVPGCFTTACIIATIIALNWDIISEHFK